MSMPGWYPDPAGAPGRFRYWDGASWSQQTTTDPTGAAASAPGQPGPQPGGRRSWGWLAALAALLVLALLVWAMFFRGGGQQAAVEDTNSASPTGPVWNEKDTPTPTPKGSSVPAPSGGAAVACPTGGGNVVPSTGDTLASTGLTVNRITGWDYPPSFHLEAVRDVQVQLDLVYQGAMEGWLSGQLVGRLAQADGFKDPRSAAAQLMDCFATSAYYTDYTGRQDLTSEAVTVDGHQGWHLRTEIRVDSPNLPNIPGDRVDIIVLDTGQAGSFAVWSGWATIGDTAREQVVDQAMGTLTVG